MSVLAICVIMAEHVLTLLVDFVASALRNGPVTYAKSVSVHAAFFFTFEIAHFDFL